MSEQPYHQQLSLKNFTAFKETTLKFVPGINAFVGENGTGKTHIMKVLYAWQLAQLRRHREMDDLLGDLFQTQDISDLVRLGSGDEAIAEATGLYNDSEWHYAIRRETGSGMAAYPAPFPSERPVFIPTIDMMGHTKGFLAAASEVVLDFDLTCSDIVTLLGLERRNGTREPIVLEGIRELLGGEIEYDGNNSRFYLLTDRGRLPMPLVAEGLRKIATLVRLAQNGWITPGTTLFWDEPEVNLNPVLMDEVVGALLTIARSGVQVFLATHSYVMLREIEVQSRKQDAVRYFALSHDIDGISVSPASSYLEIDPNPFERQYADLYDRGIAKRLGGVK